MGEFVGNLFLSLIELIVRLLVRSFGFSEEKVKKLEVVVGWSLVLIAVIGLFYLTLKYS